MVDVAADAPHSCGAVGLRWLRARSGGANLGKVARTSGRSVENGDPPRPCRRLPGGRASGGALVRQPRELARHRAQVPASPRESGELDVGRVRVVRAALERRGRGACRRRGGRSHWRDDRLVADRLARAVRRGRRRRGGVVRQGDRPLHICGANACRDLRPPARPGHVV